MRAGQFAFRGIPICSLRKAHRVNLCDRLRMFHRALESRSCTMNEAPLPTIHGEYVRRRCDVDEVAVALRAVIFDYGRVLTGPPDPAAYAELMRITGLTADRLDQFYWKDRNAYDEGKLGGGR